MEANIYINGEIGESVHLVDVIKQVQGNPFAEKYIVHINSVGGIVDVGFDIYNYLVSLNKPITTIGSGIVASIATVIFMAGSERKLRKGTDFMIHLPSGSVSGTAEEIESYNEGLKKYEKKIVDFYTKATGLTEEAIKPLLKNETWLQSSDAFDMNFTTELEIEYPAVAKAVYNFKTDTNMTNLSEVDKSWIEKKFESIQALFNKGAIKNIVLQDATGLELEFPDVAEGESPALETKVLVDGAPAEGSYLMPDGYTYVCVAGILTEILEPTDDENEEMNALRAENESLKEQLATATAEVTNNAEIVAKLKEEFTQLKSKVTSNFKAEAKKDAKKDEDADEKSAAQKALENLKSKRK